MGFDIYLYLSSRDRIQKERNELEKDLSSWSITVGNKLCGKERIDAVERISKLNRELEDRLSRD